MFQIEKLFTLFAVLIILLIFFASVYALIAVPIFLVERLGAPVFAIVSVISTACTIALFQEAPVNDDDFFE